MPLLTAALVEELNAIEFEAQGGDLSPEAKARILTRNRKMAEALERWIRTATVDTSVFVQPGQTVVTAGSAAAQSGSTTSSGTGSGVGTIS